MNATPPQQTPTTIRFTSRLLPTHSAEEMEVGTVLVLPKDASARLPSPGMNMVEGTINGFPFRAALESDGKGSHRLRANKALQAAAGATEAETVTVEITRVGDEHEVRIPVDLREALATAPAARCLWTEITPLARRDWILWISSAKQPETRRGRIAKACSMLATGKRRVCCFGGLKWLVKDHPSTGGTWLDLPPSKSRHPPRSAT